MKLQLCTASWCKQCPNMKSVLDSLQLDYEVIDIDTEQGGLFAQSKRIRSLPSLLITKDNDTEIMLVGVKTKEFMEGFVKEISE